MTPAGLQALVVESGKMPMGSGGSTFAATAIPDVLESLRNITESLNTAMLLLRAALPIRLVLLLAMGHVDVLSDPDNRTRTVIRQ